MRAGSRCGHNLKKKNPGPNLKWWVTLVTCPKTSTEHIELMRVEANYFLFFMRGKRHTLGVYFCHMSRNKCNPCFNFHESLPSVGSDWGKLYSKIAFCINRCSTHIMGFLSDWTRVLLCFLAMQDQSQVPVSVDTHKNKNINLI